MKFTTSQDTKEFIEDVHRRVNARNKAVFGGAGLFLALGEGVPKNFRVSDSQGIDLTDETIVRDELLPVVRAALNHRAGKTLDEIGYRQNFRLYFEYGCRRLKQIWEESKDPTTFISSLLKLSDFQIDGYRINPNIKSDSSIVEHEVRLNILTEGESWTINASGGNGLLIISGTPGSGKSQLALDLLVQISRQGVRFLFFDLKGELEENIFNSQQQENREKIFKQTGAKYVRLISEGLPINPLIQGSTAAENAQISSEMSSLIRAFAPQLGQNQQKAIRDAYESLTIPDFISLFQELEQTGDQGVAFSIIEKITKFNLFASHRDAIPIEEWLERSQVIDFKSFQNDNETKALAVAFILNAIMRQLNQNLPVKNGIQPLQMVLFIDEAHLLLPKDGKSGLISSLARQGRSWGFPIWLASQDADAFLTKGVNAVDFAELADCGIHFSPHNLSETEQKKILGQPFSRKLQSGEIVMRLHRKFYTGYARQFWKNKGLVNP